MKPSVSPISSTPSAVPTMTGAISSISMSGIVTTGISSDDIATQFADIYGVDSSDVETSTDYVLSGILDVIIPENIADSDAITAITESISDILGVHVKDVVITLDDDGNMTYSVIGKTFDDAQEIQNMIASTDFAADITSDLNEGDSGIVVESSTSNDDIEMIISAIVDISDATGTTNPVEEVDTMAQEYGLTDSTVEGISIYHEKLLEQIY